MSSLEKNVGQLAPNRLLTLYAITRRIGTPIDLSTFRNRLILQKAVYLIQEAGNNLGYSFGWYLSGPYESELTRDLYRLQELVAVSKPDELETKGAPVNDGLLKKAQGLIHDLEKEGDTAYWLELASSLHFLAKHAYPRPPDPKQTIDILQASKPGRFRVEDEQRAFAFLVKHGFFASNE